MLVHCSWLDQKTLGLAILTAIEAILRGGTGRRLLMLRDQLLYDVRKESRGSQLLPPHLILHSPQFQLRRTISACKREEEQRNRGRKGYANINIYSE